MAATLYLGVRLPEKPYERLKLNDINFSTKKVSELKVDAEKLLNFSREQLEFIYCGILLKNDCRSLAEQGIREGSTIHVFQKQDEEVINDEPITEEQIQKAVNSYRSVIKDAGNSLAKAIRPEVIKKVLDAYPEFHHNLGAFAILKDAILIGRMSSNETVKEIAKHYPILIRSAEFVTKTMKEYLTSNKQDNNLSNTMPSEDSLSDTSSSEGDSPMVSPNNQQGDIRQISRDQLSAALMLAGTASLNSLSNIAQRNTGSGSGVSQGQPLAVPSTSASSGTASASSSSAGSGMISNSLLSNALSQALLGHGQSPVTPANPTPIQADATALNPPTENDNLAERYANELHTMREMGLFEEMINIQALVLSNGDVEAAINLVLSGLGNFN